jgi:lipopolysaccharide export system permease protein
MAALMACGIGNSALYRPIALLSLFLAVLVAWLSLTAAPEAYSEVKRITDNARQNADLAMLTPGKFTAIGSERTVVYAEAVNEDGTLENVFVQRRNGDQVMVVVAARAGQRNEPDSGRKILTFYDGVRYEGPPGLREFRVMEFDEHGIPFEISEASEQRLRQETQTLAALVADLTPASIAELQWRLSTPVMLLILTLIAVPLSRAPPRTGRYNRLIGGVLVYISYSNLLSASKIWVEQETISPWLGLWWVHVLFVAFGLVLLMQQAGMFRRMFRRRGARS